MSSSEFPLDLIEEIFVLLRVKSLIRFKCLSKHWYVLLSNPNFTRRHLKKSTTKQSHQDTLIHGPSATDFRLVTSYQGGLVQDLGLPIAPCFIHFQAMPKLLAHCDGLLCLWGSYYCQVKEWGSCNVLMPVLLVWNPLTKEHIIFPVSDLDSRARDDVYNSFGFGYDPASNDYKIVRLIVHKNYCKVECLRLEEGSWKDARVYDVTSFPFQFVSNMTEPGEAVYVNGCLYWLTSSIHVDYVDYMILRFDLSTNRMKKVSWSDPKNVSSHVNLTRFRDEQQCLGLVEVSQSYEAYQVWMMEENSWVRLFIVSTANMIQSYYCPTDLLIWFCGAVPIYFTTSRTMLFFQSRTQELIFYNGNDGSIEKIPVVDENVWSPINSSCKLYHFVESMVSPVKK